MLPVGRLALRAVAACRAAQLASPPPGLVVIDRPLRPAEWRRKPPPTIAKAIHSSARMRRRSLDPIKARGCGVKNARFRPTLVDAMNTADLLKNIRVASPCHARWADMAGDDRTRFCAQCSKHVYNLSAMTADEGANLRQENSGNLCVRFYRRRDGTVLTTDCPVGAAGVSRRLKRILIAAVPLFIAAAVVNDWACGNRDGRSRIQSGPTLSQKLNGAMWKVKAWFGISPPVMGSICPPPPTPPPPASSGDGG